LRAPLLISVAAVPAMLIWLLGSPLLGWSNAGRPASDAMLTATISPQPRVPESSNGGTPEMAGNRRARAAGAHRHAGLVASPTGSSSAAVSLVIPRIAVRVPVIDRGVDARGNLRIANGLVVTHYSFSAEVGGVGNYIVYGHDDIQGSVFRHLDALRVGDPIELVSGGRRYLYRVTAGRVVPPTTIGVLKPTATATMTLITCTPYMVDTQRIVVDAALEGIEGV
jgi:sortase A